MIDFTKMTTRSPQQTTSSLKKSIIEVCFSPCINICIILYQVVAKCSSTYNVLVLSTLRRIYPLFFHHVNLTLGTGKISQRSGMGLSIGQRPCKLSVDSDGRQEGNFKTQYLQEKTAFDNTCYVIGDQIPSFWPLLNNLYLCNEFVISVN